MGIRDDNRQLVYQWGMALGIELAIARVGKLLHSTPAGDYETGVALATALNVLRDLLSDTRRGVPKNFYSGPERERC